MGKVDITRSMLNVIRECSNNTSRSKLIFESNEGTNSEDANVFYITEKTPQFNEELKAEQSSIIKTVNTDVTFDKEKALAFYPKDKNLILVASIKSLNITFQFKYNDSSGEGCYIWANAVQLTEANVKTINKIRSAFLNWRDNLIANGDLIDQLYKEVTQKK